VSDEEVEVIPRSLGQIVDLCRGEKQRKNTVKKRREKRAAA
jgi:hypothetical protein